MSSRKKCNPASRIWQAGKASDFATQAKHVKPGKVVLAIRVSNRARKSHLKKQYEKTKAEYEKLGWEVVDAIFHIGSGTDST